MVFFPNCKINIGLHVLERRADGYHNLETLFFPLPLQDALEIIKDETPQNDDVRFTTTGLSLNINAADNLCVKAYQLLKKDFTQLPSIKLHLHKVIPAGAGLGGGSADAAFTLLLLNKKFGLNLTQEQLLWYALQLGSDCPFFIINNPAIGHGRGEVLEEFPLSLQGFQLIIVNPCIHINTGWAFSQIKQRAGRKSLKDLAGQKIESWKEDVVNDFEDPIFRAYPQIHKLKDDFYEKGAVYASMSGSGSTVYGIFKKEENPVFTYPEHYFVYKVTL